MPAQQARVRWWDADASAPGLPPDVAVLISRIDPHETVLSLVNSSTTSTRTCVMQAGFFAEHSIVGLHVGVDARDHGVERQDVSQASPCRYLRITLPPSTTLSITLALDLRRNRPTFASPWTSAEDAA